MPQTTQRSLHDLSTERVVLDLFVGEPHWSHTALKVELAEIDAGAIETALVGLLVEGVLERTGAEGWRLARAVRHLGTLGLLDPGPGSPNGSALEGIDAGLIERMLAREALRDYARRREADHDPAKLVAELPVLADRALAAGLDAATVSALAEGRRV